MLFQCLWPCMPARYIQEILCAQQLKVDGSFPHFTYQQWGLPILPNKVWFCPIHLFSNHSNQNKNAWHPQQLRQQNKAHPLLTVTKKVTENSAKQFSNGGFKTNTEWWSHSCVNNITLFSENLRFFSEGRWRETDKIMKKLWLLAFPFSNSSGHKTKWLCIYDCVRPDAFLIMKWRHKDHYHTLLTKLCGKWVNKIKSWYICHTHTQQT
jgi:hypothetical protein